MYKAKPLTIFCRVRHTIHWVENGVTVLLGVTRVPLHAIFPRKTLFTDRTGPTHVNSMKAKLKLTKRRMFHIYIDCTTITTILLFHNDYHHLWRFFTDKISNVNTLLLCCIYQCHVVYINVMLYTSMLCSYISMSCCIHQ